MSFNPIYFQPFPAQLATSYKCPVSSYSNPTMNIQQENKCAEELDSLKTNAFNQYAKGNKDLAINYLEKSVNVYGAGNPKSVETLLLLGRIYRETKQYDKALFKLQQAKMVQPMMPFVDPMPPNQVNIELGKTYYEIGDLGKAQEYLDNEKTLLEMRNGFITQPSVESTRDLQLVNIYLANINKVLVKR